MHFSLFTLDFTSKSSTSTSADPSPNNLTNDVFPYKPVSGETLISVSTLPQMQSAGFSMEINVAVRTEVE